MQFFKEPNLLSCARVRIIQTKSWSQISEKLSEKLLPYKNAFLVWTRWDKMESNLNSMLGVCHIFGRRHYKHESYIITWSDKETILHFGPCHCYRLTHTVAECKQCFVIRRILLWITIVLPYEWAFIHGYVKRNSSVPINTHVQSWCSYL